MWLTILCLVFLPSLLVALSDAVGLDDFFGPLAAVVMCIGIPWAVIHFRNQTRLLEQHRWQLQAQLNQLPVGMPMPAAQPYLQAPQQTPIQTPVAPAYQQPYAPQPVYQTPASARPEHPPNTNPLGSAPGSVIEDETRRLPGE